MIDVKEAPATPVRPSVDPEKTSPVKPSEYMRLGAMETQPWQRSLVEIHCEYSKPEDRMAPPSVYIRSACAMGAIAVGTGLKTTISEINSDGTFSVMTNEPDEWTRMSNVLSEHTVDTAPCGCVKKDSADVVIIHLNDDEGWTRPQIADWLEGIGL